MMPNADMFAPDINFVSARGVYPTMRGGTTASASGAMTTSTNVIAADPTTGETAPATASGPAISMSGHTVWWWVGFLGLLIGMVLIARKAGGPEDFRNIRPTLYNALAITLTSIVGIVGLKVIATRYRIPGASDVILAV